MVVLLPPTGKETYDPRTWTATDLNAAANAGRKVRIDIGYGTDSRVSGAGLWIDEITLTNFYEIGPDARANSACP